MRRAAGSHIRTNRQKLALLQRTTLEDRKIAPSLRSNHVRKILQKHEQAQKLVDALHVPSLVVDRPPVTRHTPRRRSLPKEESPRSGLKPHDTLGADDRRQSACSIAERRIEEHRKYSSYGVESPIPIEIPTSGEEIPERSPSISYTRQPVRSLSAGWKESFRRKLNVFRRPSPSSLSSRSTQQFLSPSPEMSCKSNPETVKMKKSISFSETTRNALRRSFRQKPHLLCVFNPDALLTRENTIKAGGAPQLDVRPLSFFFPSIPCVGYCEVVYTKLNGSQSHKLAELFEQAPFGFLGLPPYHCISFDLLLLAAKLTFQR